VNALELVQQLAADIDDLVVWRAEHSTIALNTYASPEAARAHAEAHYRSVNGTAPALAWYEEHPDASAAMVLYARHEGREVLTAYRIVPLTVLDNYDPDGES
jgi:hypothetical protein